MFDVPDFEAVQVERVVWTGHVVHLLDLNRFRGDRGMSNEAVVANRYGANLPDGLGSATLS